MTYVIMGLLVVLALLFDFSVWMWLRANPVPPLAPIPDWRVTGSSSTAASTAWQDIGETSAWAVTATSAHAVISTTAGRR